MRIFLIYYKAINSLNIPISAAYTMLMGAAREEGWMWILLHFAYTFACCFVTAGLWLSVFLYNLKPGKHYYFYYNNGLSKLQLFLYTTLANLLVVPFLFILQKLLQWVMN